MANRGNPPVRATATRRGNALLGVALGLIVAALYLSIQLVWAAKGY